MTDWMTDEDKPYLWLHKEQPIEVICYTNDQDPSIKCIWVRMLHDGEYVSNYFSYSKEALDVEPLDFAMNMVEQFKDDGDE